MSDPRDVARRIAAVAPHTSWPRQLAAALELEAVEPEPADGLPARVASHLEAVDEETVSDLLYDLRTLEGDATDHGIGH